MASDSSQLPPTYTPYYYYYYYHYYYYYGLLPPQKSRGRLGGCRAMTPLLLIADPRRRRE